MAARPIAQLALAVVVAVAALAASSAGATQFRVGGDKGWSVPGAGSEPYNTWAGRLRFQIGDQLLFVYPNGTDSVLLVDAAAYNACNTSAYVARFDDGNTVFTLDRSGPFFFVSGNEASCRANEKLFVVVLADRSGTRTPPAAPSSPPAAAPGTSPPSSSPPSGAAAPVPAPAAATPTSSPPSPAASAPAPAPTTTPSSPPAPAPQTPSPSTTPTPPGGGMSPPPTASANAPAGEGGSSTTPPPPSAAAPAVAGFVGSLGAIIGYAMLAA